MIAYPYIALLMLPGSMLLLADAPATLPEMLPPPETENRVSSLPPVVMEFETCISKIHDERTAIDATAQVQALVPRMKELLLARHWENPEDALVLAQILNAAFNLLLTEPPCYGSPELAEAIGELLSVFTGK